MIIDRGIPNRSMKDVYDVVFLSALKKIGSLKIST